MRAVFLLGRHDEEHGEVADAATDAAPGRAAHARLMTEMKKPSVPVRRGVSTRPLPASSAAAREARARAAGDDLGRRHARELRLAGEERRDLVLVLLGQQRAGDIDEPAAGLDEAARRRQAAPPARRCARRARARSAAIWHRAAAARRRCRCRARRSARRPCGRRDRRARRRPRAPGRCGRRRASADRRSARAARGRCRWRRPGPCCPCAAASASVLPPAPAQRSSTCSPGLGADHERGDLAALVLHLEPALLEGRLDLHVGVAALACRSARCAGRPARTASRPRRSGPAPSATFGRSAFSRLTRMSSGGRSASASPSATQSSPNRRSKRGASHSGTSARTCGGAAARSASARRSALVRRSAARAHGDRRRTSRPARRRRGPSASRRSPSTSARGVSAPMTQAPDSAPAQRVVDDVADGGAVAGAGEAMRDAPVLQRLGNRPVARLDRVQHLDRRGEPPALSHAASSTPITGRGGPWPRRSATSA